MILRRRFCDSNIVFFSTPISVPGTLKWMANPTVIIAIPTAPRIATIDKPLGILNMFVSNMLIKIFRIQEDTVHDIVKADCLLYVHDEML